MRAGIDSRRYTGEMFRKLSIGFFRLTYQQNSRQGIL